ncbi:hypothetical protein GCM10023170_063960 [Phytohabitans houttuyneae]|uniref:Uncharacterized protein n=1 Tax=Phytohabitans houttuyneae TaxID=1076126 RepID=A0A6V8K951_9ACTN|nr:hypothetical protein Phou_059030 [Phytohabitans houttuyneae]
MLTVMSGVAANSGGAVSTPAAVTTAVAAATNAIWDFFMGRSTGSCGSPPRIDGLAEAPDYEILSKHPST